MELIRRSFLEMTEQIEISIAHSVHEAKLLLSKSIPDLILLDYLLPDGKGIELLSEDKTNLPDPIIIMTSHGNELVAVESLKKEALDYVIKSKETITDMPRICERALREWKLIIESKRTEENIRKLFQAIEQSQNLVIITDFNGKIEYVNPRFDSTTGDTKEEAIGKNPNILKSGNTPIEEYQRLWDTILTRKEWRGELHNRKKNGELYWGKASISPIRNEKGAITHFLGIKEDITERKQFEQQLTHMELHDPLTNLYNGTNTDSLISYADLAMYQAKEKGNDRVCCFFSPDHAAQLESMINWKQQIQDTLVNNKFVLYLHWQL
ncbi:MAG: PAS domain S-box protein [Candidatus Kuenenia sp.]|nr:PAS domain S-box protein [Candidatus Kuenenia hertensis]